MMVRAYANLVLVGNLRDDLGDCSFKLLDADVLEDDRTLGQQTYLCCHLLALNGHNTMFTFLEPFSKAKCTLLKVKAVTPQND